jgi:K+-transporting ATPase KdpF subunit
MREVAVREAEMNLESILGLAASALLLLYLAYALLRPEKF